MGPNGRNGFIEDLTLLRMLGLAVCSILHLSSLEVLCPHLQYAPMVFFCHHRLQSQSQVALAKSVSQNKLFLLIAYELINMSVLSL